MKLLSTFLIAFLVLNLSISHAQSWSERADINPNIGYFGEIVSGQGDFLWAVSGNTIAQSCDRGNSWTLKYIDDFGRDDITNASLFFLDENTGFLLRRGSFWGMILKTSDGGSTWQLIRESSFDLLPLYQGMDIKFFNESVGIISCLEGKILKTVDGGNNWMEVNTPLSGSLANLYEISIVDEQTAWVVGATGAILKTEDQGQSWIQQDILEGREILYDVEFSTALDGWIVGNGGLILRTEDGGESWNSVFGIGEESSIYRSIAFSDENQGYICGDIVGDRNVHKTSDGGDNWEAIELDITNPLHLLETNNEEPFILTQNGAIYTTAQFSSAPLTCPEEEGIRMYPNPTQDILKLFGQLEGSSFRLIDLKGKICQEGDLTSNVEKISLLPFAKGVYILEIDRGADVSYTKIVKY
ncbi:MAG: YCF48-related protein [Bacteroidia bacterium]|nr:YCF48-related protein [Bacteroidia bacterium]